MAQLVLQVAASNQDANEDSATGAMDLTVARCTFGSFEAGGGTHVGLYFPIAAASRTLLNGPNLRIQTTSKLPFQSVQDDSDAFVGDWKIEDSKAPAVFTTTASDISNRTFLGTTMEGDGSDFGNWSSNTAHDFTTDGTQTVASLLQALFDKYEDVEAVVFAWIYTSGTGERLAESYDVDPAMSPKLTIDYEYIPDSLRVARARMVKA